MATRCTRFTSLLVFSVCLVGPVTGLAQVDMLQFGTNHTAEMTAHGVTTGWGEMEGDRYRIAGFGDAATWDLSAPDDGIYSLEVVIGIGTARKATVEWVAGGVLQSSGLIVGATSFEIVTNRYPFLVPGGASAVECTIFTPPEASLPSIYSSALYGPGDNAIRFGSDHVVDMASQGMTLIPDGSHTIHPERINCNGDWASVEWHLATRGAGVYSLEAVVGLGSTRKAEIFWGVGGITNSSGEIAGVGDYQVLTNTYPVVVTAGVPTVHCVFDATQGLPAVIAATLGGGPPPLHPTLFVVR